MAKAAKKSTAKAAASSAKKNRVVLAYSGGLDTSVLVRWLEQRGYEVICFCANVGQVEKYKDLEKKALNSGATRCYIRDV
jgi:argininosuccinate synthase